jgi:A/G-specific adenine glycosylase
MKECEAFSRGIVQRLPRIAPKKAPKRVPRVGFVIRSKGRVLLARRVESGLFGGMWEPPHIDEALAGDLLGGDEVLLGTLTHVLSHRRIEMTVYGGRGVSGLVPALRARLGEYDRISWVALGELDGRPLTSLARKVLALGTANPGRAAEPPGNCRGRSARAI